MSTKVTSPDELPQKPGIYIMKDKNEKIIYIGKSKSLKNRVKSYFQKNLDRPKTQVLMSHFNSLEYIITNSEAIPDDIVDRYAEKGANPLYLDDEQRKTIHYHKL